MVTGVVFDVGETPAAYCKVCVHAVHVVMCGYPLQSVYTKSKKAELVASHTRTTHMNSERAKPQKTVSRVAWCVRQLVVRGDWGLDLELG